jgi:hypothetical protein
MGSRTTARQSHPAGARVTVTKSIRLTEDELRHVRQLQPQYPECASEADLLRQATLLGLYVLAAQATGTPAYGGYRPGELIALLKYRVLPAIDFLLEHNAYPALYQARAVVDEPSPARAAVGAEASPAEILPDAATFLGELGADFMDA